MPLDQQPIADPAPQRKHNATAGAMLLPLPALIAKTQDNSAPAHIAGCPPTILSIYPSLRKQRNPPAACPQSPGHVRSTNTSTAWHQFSGHFLTRVGTTTHRPAPWPGLLRCPFRCGPLFRRSAGRARFQRQNPARIRAAPRLICRRFELPLGRLEPLQRIALKNHAQSGARYRSRIFAAYRGNAKCPNTVCLIRLGSSTVWR